MKRPAWILVAAGIVLLLTGIMFLASGDGTGKGGQGVMACDPPARLEVAQNVSAGEREQRTNPSVESGPVRQDVKAQGSVRQTSANVGQVPPRTPGVKIVESGAVSDGPVRRLIASLLNRQWEGVTPEDKQMLQSIIAQQQGKECVDALLDAYAEPESRDVTRVVRNSRIIQILSEMASGGSREAGVALYDMAMRGDAQSTILPQRAARAYAAAEAGHPEEIAKLLQTKDLGIRLAAVQAIAGNSLTPEIIKKLGEQLQVRDVWMQAAVASAFAKDPGFQGSSSKVDLLLKASNAAGELKDAERETEGTGGWSIRQWALRQYVDALTNIKGGEEVLLGRLLSEDGQSMALIVIALARRGSQSVHGQLSGLIRQTKDGAIKTLAVEAMTQVGDATDVGLLEELKAADDFRLNSPGTGRERYPVREAASRALQKIQHGG